MGLFDFFKNPKKESPAQISIRLEPMFTDPISPEEYNQKREVERQYLESKYDFNSIEGIHAIPVSIRENHPELICGVTGNIEYFLQTKAAQHEKDGHVELALACYRKANEIMPLRGDGFYDEDRYMRLPRYLRKLRRFDEARAEEEKIKKRFDCIDLGADALKRTFQQAKIMRTDLLEASYIRACCAECAKFRNRVYSISGKDIRFPKLPSHLLNTQHDCGISLFPFLYRVNSMQDPSGKTVDPIQYSRRPFVDDRDENEKADYLKFLQRQEDERIRKLVSADYDWVWEFLPELCPKWCSDYAYMRKMQSKKYKQIVQAASAQGKILTPLQQSEQPNACEWLLEFLRANEGILQKDIYQHFDTKLKSEIQHALSLWAEDGTIIRERSGHSYRITLPKQL